MRLVRHPLFSRQNWAHVRLEEAKDLDVDGLLVRPDVSAVVFRSGGPCGRCRIKGLHLPQMLLRRLPILSNSVGESLVVMNWYRIIDESGEILEQGSAEVFYLQDR